MPLAACAFGMPHDSPERTEGEEAEENTENTFVYLDWFLGMKIYCTIINEKNNPLLFKFSNGYFLQSILVLDTIPDGI